MNGDLPKNGRWRSNPAFWTFLLVLISAFINILMLTASLYVQVGYVPRSEFNAFKDKLESSEKEVGKETNNQLRDIAKQLQVIADQAPFKQQEEDRQNERIAALENRKH